MARSLEAKLDSALGIQAKQNQAEAALSGHTPQARGVNQPRRKAP